MPCLQKASTLSWRQTANKQQQQQTHITLMRLEINKKLYMNSLCSSLCAPVCHKLCFCFFFTDGFDLEVEGELS